MRLLLMQTKQVRRRQGVAREKADPRLSAPGASARIIRNTRRFSCNMCCAASLGARSPKGGRDRRSSRLRCHSQSQLRLSAARHVACCRSDWHALWSNIKPALLFLLAAVRPNSTPCTVRSSGKGSVSARADQGLDAPGLEAEPKQRPDGNCQRASRAPSSLLILRHAEEPG